MYYLKSVKLGNLCAFLNEGGHLVLVAEQRMHDGPARLPLSDNCAQHRHTVQLCVLVKMTTTVEVDNEEFTYIIIITGGFLVFFSSMYCSKLLRRMLGSNTGLLRLRHWQSDA